MKCSSCGAETTGKFCEYCGSEQVTAKTNAGACPKCGNGNVTFKRERVGTATQSTSRKNVIGKGRTGVSVSQTAYRTVGVCQNCGYTWNPNGNNNSSNRKTWLWVLGWICIFPVPLTILMLRKKDMKPAVKYGVIAVAWLLFFIIGLTGNSNEDKPQVDTTQPVESVQVEQTETAADDTIPETTEVIPETTENDSPWAKQEANIRSFVNQFNEISDTPIVDIDFVKNHTIAYLIVDGFGATSIKVNDHSEIGFLFTFEFNDGTASLEKYETLMRDIVKVIDADVDVGEKFIEANANQNTNVHLSDTIFVEYNYAEEAFSIRAADSYIITLTVSDYNKQ